MLRLAVPALLAALVWPVATAGATESQTTAEETRQEVHIGRPSGLAPPTAESMAAWHRRYAPLARPVKQALGRFLKARRERPPGRLGKPCSALGKSLQTFHRQAREHRLFPVADAAVDVHVKRLYIRLGEVAEACADDRWAETEESLRQAGLAFRQASLALGRWDAEP